MLRLAQFSLLALTMTCAAAAQGLGTVYTESNATTANRVQVSLRLPSGQLVPFASFDTGGEGTGAGLGSQGALAFAAGNRLLAVNAGSNELTLFRVLGGALLWRTDIVGSGGDRPTSVTAHGNHVYVLNADSDAVRGFRIQGNHLQPLPDATYPLSQSGAAGGSAGASTASSYRLLPSGDLVTLTSSAPTTQSAACWAAIPRHGDFAYTANTGSGTVTGYSLGNGGNLALLAPNGVSASLVPGGRAIDLDFDDEGRFLFVLDSFHDTINTFRRRHDGSLEVVGTPVQVIDGAAGLVAR